MLVDEICEDGFLGVKSIFGLMDDDGAGAVENFVGDFDVAADGEAMHEFGVELGGFEPGFGNAPLAEVLAGLHFGGGVAVVLGGDPGFAVENVGVFERFSGGVGVANGLCAEGFGFGDQFIGEGVRLRGMDGDVHSAEGGHGESGAGDGVGERFGVPGPAEDEVAVRRNVEFIEGLPVGEGLAGVVAGGFHVDEGFGGEVGEFVHEAVSEVFGEIDLVGEGSDAEDVAVGGENRDGFADVFDFGAVHDDSIAGFESPGSGSGLDDDAGSSHLTNSGLEAGESAEAGVHEEESDDFAIESVVDGIGFELPGEVDEGLNLIAGEGAEGEEVLHLS